MNNKRKSNDTSNPDASIAKQAPFRFPCLNKTNLKNADNEASSNDYLSNNEVEDDWSEVKQGTEDVEDFHTTPPNQQQHPHLWYSPDASKSLSYGKVSNDNDKFITPNHFEVKKPVSRDDIDAGARIDHYLEMHIGGSLVRIKPTEVNPFKEHWEVGDGIRGKKTAIKVFSPKSRKNLLKKLACINQTRIPEDMVQFLTLTIDGNDTPICISR